MELAFFFIEVLSVPIFIFFPARKITEWVMGFILLFAFLFYYAATIVQVLQTNNISLDWLVSFLSAYQGFLLSHWPQFGGLFTVDYSFSPAPFPLLILWISGVVRFVVVRFVPNDKLREFTHENWLYYSTILILLLIISAVYNWSILISLLIFLIVLIVVAAGLHRLPIHLIVLVYGVVLHIGKGLWAALKQLWAYIGYIALFAIDIAKIFDKFFKNIKRIYDTYIVNPFLRLHERLNKLEEGWEQAANRKGIQVHQKLSDRKLEDEVHMPTKRGIVITLLILLVIGAASIVYFVAINPKNGISTAVIAANPYPSYLSGNGRLTFYDVLNTNNNGYNWDENAGCQFSGNSYHVFSTTAHLFSTCGSSTNDFSNFAFEAQMQFVKGDCGGLTFRSDNANAKQYLFYICQDGTYTLAHCDGFNKPCPTLTGGSSSAITSDFNETNLLAIVAKDNQIDLFVNQQQVGSIKDNTYSHGQVGFNALEISTSTEVIFNNVRIWLL